MSFSPCFVSFFYLWVPGFSPLRFSLISSLVFILSLAQFCALEDVLSTEYNPGLLYNQISCEHTHTHTHISVRTCVCRAETHVHIIYSKNFNINEHNHKGKQTFLHTLKQKSAKCTHTHSHVILPQGSDSSESFTCVLCTDTRQQNLDYVQHRQRNSALFDQNKAFALKYSNIPWDVGTQKWPCAYVSTGILRWMRYESHWALS